MRECFITKTSKLIGSKISLSVSLIDNVREFTLRIYFENLLVLSINDTDSEVLLPINLFVLVIRHYLTLIFQVLS